MNATNEQNKSQEPQKCANSIKETVSFYSCRQAAYVACEQKTNPLPQRAEN